MKKYKIADIVVSMEPDTRTEKQAKKYEYLGDESPVFHVQPKTFEEFKKRKDLDMTYEDFLYLSCGQSFHLQLFDYNGMYIHASSIVVNDNAYLFSAPSGTGKSTHTNLWLKKFNDNAFILDDDKPVVRIMDDGIFAYGTPWSGKHDISANKKVKLQAICFLKRDKINWIRKLNYNESAFKIYENCSKKIPAESLYKYLEIINVISDNINIYEMGCTPTIDAVDVAYEMMKPTY